MTDFQADNINCWSAELGMLPIQLFAGNESANQYILLNGNNGNFCIDVNPDIDEKRARDFAWSSNAGHFVDVSGEKILLYHWDILGKSAIEKIPSKYVSDNLDKFYKYLLDKQPKQENSIINYTIRSFRKLKYCIRNDANPMESLKAFLVLLASVIDNQSLSDLNFDKWGLQNTDIEIARRISNQDWEALIDEISIGLKYFDLKPEYSLVMRHASGKLFQEAHYESLFINQSQLTFPGMLMEASSSNIKIPSVGVHYTPSSIVRTMVEESLYFYKIHDKYEIKVLDPACGSGEFLRETLRQLKAMNFRGKVTLVGWDTSTIAIDMARFILTFEKREWGDSDITIDLQVKDSLNYNTNWPNDINIVLMNPPFLSWDKMDNEQKHNVENTLKDLKEKKPDYSSAFLFRAAECLSKNGVISAILPASFLSGESNKKLREYFKAKLDTLLLGRLGSQLLFSDALIDSSIVIAQNSDIKISAPTSLWADVNPDSAAIALRTLRKLRKLNDDSTIINHNNYSIYKDKLIVNSSNWTPRSFESFKINEQLKEFNKVEDFFIIQQGIRTGYNPVFIIEKEYFISLPIIEQEYFRPCVINKSIKSGQLNDSYYVFYPYDESGITITSESQLKSKLKVFYHDKLKPNREILETRKGIESTYWWGLTRHRDWQVNRNPKLISTYFGSSGSFAFDDDGQYAIVQGFGWTPKVKFDLNFDIYFSYLAILHSDTIDRLLSTVANQVSGGQFELSKRYISNMPFPNLFDKSMFTYVQKLSIIGKEIHSGNQIDKSDLDKIVRTIYNF